MCAARICGFLQGKRVLELGAGLGAVGMALAKKGARVVLTDKAESMVLLKRNVEENFGKEHHDQVKVCGVRDLTWTRLGSTWQAVGL